MMKAQTQTIRNHKQGNIHVTHSAHRTYARRETPEQKIKAFYAKHKIHVLCFLMFGAFFCILAASSSVEQDRPFIEAVLWLIAGIIFALPATLIKANIESLDSDSDSDR